MRKLTLLLVAIAATVALSATAAFAYTLNPDGTGFVGKGEVQTAFGWNNTTLQKNAGGVTFSYNSTDTYTAVCTFTTGEGTRGEQTHNISHTTSTQVSSSVAYDPRVRNQITGFTLKGFGATTETGTVPVVGEPCPGNAGTDGIWSSVTPTGSTGGLYANFGGVSVLLTPTPTA